MNVRLGLLTAVMAICNITTAGTIRNTLLKEHFKTKGRILVAKKYGADMTPYIVKEIALAGICDCMLDERTLDESDAFFKCFEEASFLNGYMESKEDNDLYANALDEIKSLITTNQNQDNTPIEK